jgi:hypothetical protein
MSIQGIGHRCAVGCPADVICVHEDSETAYTGTCSCFSAKVDETPSSSSHHALAWLLGRSRNCNCGRGRNREELRMSRYADNNPFLLPCDRDSEVSYAIVVDSPQRPLVPGTEVHHDTQSHSWMSLPSRSSGIPVACNGL